MDEYKRVYAKIDLDAIYNNLKAVRAKVGDQVAVIAVIKADAYGHGAVEVGRHVEEIVDGFAVAVIEEAILLREKGLKKPMLLLGYTDETQYEDLIRYDISQTVYTYEMAKKLSDVAVAMKKDAVVHIKLDTGMGRIGFQPNSDSIVAIKKISELPNVKIAGMFTHFSKADMNGEGVDYTRKQFDTYMNFASQLKENGVEIPKKHVANSAGIMEYPETYLDEVRSGIITYGLYPSEDVNPEDLMIQPALELKSHVVHIKTVEAGASIGYGGTYVAKERRTIATIPVGYGDGYPRSLSNKGRVLIHGQSAPIVGRICMDQFMVDITGLDVSLRDEVTLIGTDHGAKLSVEEVANLSGSFNYEFCCDIGRRVPRVYYKNGTYYKTVSFFNC